MQELLCKTGRIRSQQGYAKKERNKEVKVVGEIAPADIPSSHADHCNLNLIRFSAVILKSERDGHVICD